MPDLGLHRKVAVGDCDTEHAAKCSQRRPAGHPEPLEGQEGEHKGQPDDPGLAQRLVVDQVVDLAVFTLHQRWKFVLYYAL